MPKFIFKAKNINNELIEGARNAGSKQELVSILRNEGLVIFSVYEEQEKLIQLKKRKTIVSKRGRVTYQDIAVFCRQLYSLIDAGISILDAIDDIALMAVNVKFQKVLQSVSKDIREGKTLSEAVHKHEKVFGNVFVALISSGEKSGKLSKILRDLTVYMESVVALRRKIQSASAYPVFISGFLFAVLIGVLVFLVPRFKGIYDSFGATLPLPTRVLMAISDAVIGNIVFVLIGIVALVFAYNIIQRNKSVRMTIDRIKLELPIFGPIINKIVLARFFQTLATLLKSGLDIVTAFEVASRVCGNTYVEQVIIGVKNRLIEGATLSEEMEKSSVFQRMVIRMASSGEKSGKLDEMFSRVSEYYNDEVNATISMLSSIIEPVLIIALGLIVGVIVIVLYLPIFFLAGAVLTQQS